MRTAESIPMVDIHCHLLYGVDDGAGTIEESQAMLKAAHDQGVEAVILTPHYRHGMFAYPIEEITEHFQMLVPFAAQLGMTLGLGTEYHVNSRIVEYMEKGRCLTLAGSRYILTEYSGDSAFSYIYQMSQELIRNGYVPVIAHAERYACLGENPDQVRILRESGVWIQVNADAVLGKEGMGLKGLCRKFLREELVDIVASDSHGVKRRACHMEQCRDFLTKKYGREYAALLLRENPLRILSGNIE